MVVLSISSEKVALTLAVGATPVAFALGEVLMTFGVFFFFFFFFLDGVGWRSGGCYAKGASRLPVYYTCPYDLSGGIDPLGLQ